MRHDPWLDAVASLRHTGAGVAGWWLHVAETRHLALMTKDRQTGNAHTPLSLSASLGAEYLICWEDGRVSRGNLERSAFETDLRAPLEAARSAAYEDPDATAILGPASFADVPLHDAEVARAASGDTAPLIARWDEVRERVGQAGCTTWSGSLEVREVEVRVLTSERLDVSGRGTLQSWYVSVDGEIGSGHRQRCFEPLAEFSGRLARLLEIASLLREAAPVLDGGLLPVVLHPHVVEELVLATVLHHLSAATVAHAEGRFRKEQFGAGEPVLREDLALRLDPLRPLAAGSYRFTREGLPAAPCTYIERGALVTPIADLKYARRLGIPPTPIPYGYDGLCFEGPRPLGAAEAYARAEGGALVLNVLGVHTLDAASGDFSLSAPQVLRLGPSGPRGRWRATISGNLFDLLRSETLQLVAFEGEHTPGMLVSCRLDPK